MRFKFARVRTEEKRRKKLMAHTVPVIGIEPAELRWIRMLVFLLRHPDPVVPELTRQALEYLETAAVNSDDKKNTIFRVSNSPI